MATDGRCACAMNARVCEYEYAKEMRGRRAGISKFSEKIGNTVSRIPPKLAN